MVAYLGEILIDSESSKNCIPFFIVSGGGVFSIDNSDFSIENYGKIGLITLLLKGILSF